MALDNKLGITNSPALAREEERISKIKAMALFDSGRLFTLNPGTFETLAIIHTALFEDIYDFAGQLRVVNMAKGQFRFAPVLYLQSALEQIEAMPQKTFGQIVEKYVEMNIAHPFREGNGRSMRIWLDLLLAKELGQAIDWSAIDKEAYLQAMERSPVNDMELKYLLEKALTADFNSRESFIKGIDHSYYYEGYQEFSAKEL